MPSKSTRRRPTTKDDVRPVTADTPPVAGPEADTPALPPTAPDTAATRGVWAALVAQPGSTAAVLADAAGISRSAAAKALAALESAGLATRALGGREGSKRLADQWQPAIPSGASASEGEATEVAEPGAPEDTVMFAEKPEDDGRESADGVEDVSSAPAPEPASTKTDTGKARLGSGQLRDMVLQVLRDYPDQDFSPSAMGKLLDRSSGAISNACDRLQADGAVMQTSDKPRRFRLAAAKS